MKQPEISLTLNDDALQAAVAEYTAKLFGNNPVNVSKVTFTAGRGANGYSAEVVVTQGSSAFVGTVAQEAVDKPAPDKVAKPASKVAAKAEPEAKEEAVTEELVEEETAEVEVTNEAPKKPNKLFGT